MKTRKTLLREKLDFVHTKYHSDIRSGGALRRAREQHAVAVETLKALRSEVDALLSDAHRVPGNWFDDLGAIASNLIDALPE